eukprot:6619391-Pyramimonas_sp.AAC.1
MNPSPAVRRCLELVFVTLHISKLRSKINALPDGKRLHIDWFDVQRMLTKFQWFYPAMSDESNIQPLVDSPKVCAYLEREYFEGPDALTEERLRRSSAACV